MGIEISRLNHFIHKHTILMKVIVMGGKFHECRAKFEKSNSFLSLENVHLRKVIPTTYFKN